MAKEPMICRPSFSSGTLSATFREEDYVRSRENAVNTSVKLSTEMQFSKGTASSPRSGLYGRKFVRPKLYSVLRTMEN